MNKHLTSEHVQNPGGWEYDGDTGNIEYPSLFPDDELSTIDHRDVPSADHSIDTDDGAFTTITNLLAEGIRSKSTFEVVEIEASSYAVSESLQSATNVTAGSGEVALVSSDTSPSFPDGALVDHPFDEYHRVKARYSDPPNNTNRTIVQNEDQDQSADDGSTTLSSLTNNESMFLRWLNPKDRVDMLFDPFRDAMRPPRFEQNNGSSREVSGLNRMIVTSARNLSSIFRPRPHPEFHFNRPPSAPAISTSSTPENLVITTTHSVTPSLCTSASDNRVSSLQISTQAHSASQPFNNDMRDRYCAAVMRSYQLKHSPLVPSSSSYDENNKQKRCKVLIMMTCFAFVICVATSVAVAVPRKNSSANEKHVSNSADKHRQVDGTLPSACCVDDIMQSPDEVHVDVETAEPEEDAGTSVYAVEVALPAAGDRTGNEGSSEAVEVDEPVDVVVFASSQNNEPQPSLIPPTPISSHVTTPHVASIDIFGSKTEVPTSTMSPTRADTTVSVILPQDPTDLVTFIATTKKPTKQPSKKPSHRPTRIKTRRPSNKPTPHPTMKPSIRDLPSMPATPTARPTDSPSLSPITFPTFMPSTLELSVDPTTRISDYLITHKPSDSPVTSEPTLEPSVDPTRRPLNHPITYEPSGSQVTTEPTDSPVTADPTDTPTFPITISPSNYPSQVPSSPPLAMPSLNQIPSPSNDPTPLPSPKITLTPTQLPSLSPLRTPTAEPSAEVIPTPQPSPYPIFHPTLNPSAQPSSKPFMTTFAPSTPSPSTSPLSLPNPTPYPTPEPTDYVTTDCADRKFTYNDEGCTNDSAGGEYELYDCCDQFYGSFASCVFVDVCGVYTHQPSPKPTLIDTPPAPGPTNYPTERL